MKKAKDNREMEIGNPFFSIIIPIYNVEKYITQCINSIIEQTCKDYELILVDDGSPDKCPKICDDYTLKHSQIITVHKKNGGLSSARNAGLRVARGKYLIFVDGDDYWDDSTALNKIYTSLNKSNVDMIIWKAKHLNIHTEIIEDDTCDFSGYEDRSTAEVLHYLNTRSKLSISACLRAVKRSIVIDNALSFVEGKTTEDIEWTTNLYEKSTCISLIDSSHYVYRTGRPNSISNSIGVKSIYDYIDIFQLCIDRILSGRDELKSVLLDYFAYQFLLLCAHTYAIRGTQEYHEILPKIKRLDDTGIMKHRGHPRVKTAGIVYDMFGYKGIILILGIYLKYR